MQQQQSGEAVCNPNDSRHLITSPEPVQGNGDASFCRRRNAAR
jgi:hypothetical protein